MAHFLQIQNLWHNVPQVCGTTHSSEMSSQLSVSGTLLLIPGGAGACATLGLASTMPQSHASAVWHVPGGSGTCAPAPHGSETEAREGADVS